MERCSECVQTLKGDHRQRLVKRLGDRTLSFLTSIIVADCRCVGCQQEQRHHGHRGQRKYICQPDFRKVETLISSIEKTKQLKDNLTLLVDQTHRYDGVQQQAMFGSETRPPATAPVAISGTGSRPRPMAMPTSTIRCRPAPAHPVPVQKRQVEYG